MTTCPPEWAAQVDAVFEPPFSSKDAPLGNWFKNNQGNICLTLPDNSYYYFNLKRDWYFLQREPNKDDRDCKSIYISPPGDRYYNPSSDVRQAGSSFIGVYWRTSVEKVCNTDNDGNISFTFRKLFDVTDLPNLPRKYIAVFTNRYGTQRVVEVDEFGVYNGNTQWVMDEIDYWLANLVPVNDTTGPEWRRAQARQLTPPSDGEESVRIPSPRRRSSRSSSRASTPSIKKEEEDTQSQMMEQEEFEGEPSGSESDHSFDGMSNISRGSTPNFKSEELDEMDEMDEINEEEFYDSYESGGEESHESSESEEEEMDDEDMEDQQTEEEDDDEAEHIPAPSGSGRACMRNLLAARRPQATRAVQGSRISKNITARKAVRGRFL